MANKIQKLTQSRAEVQRILNESDGLRRQVESELATLKGEGEGSVSAAVEAGVRRVLGGASEAYDTLKEIEKYIEKDEAGAVVLAQNIAKNAKAIEAIAKEVKDLEETSYANLVYLRDKSELFPGRLYRITDYITTTAQANTQSAGHPFDIIVLALSESELSEQAWAVQSARDTDGYFANSKLSAWKIWYCLDNNTSRFDWADETNGKGVIYRVIDEHGNDCPYDFKNIQFKHPNDPVVYPAFYYTFSTVISGVVGDHSFNGAYCNKNEIGVYVTNKKRYLNRIVFINTSKTSACYANSFGNNCYSNSFANYCNSNSFGNYCNSNSFGNSCYSNSFDTYCYRNSFGDKNIFNSFGNACYSNSFGTYCRYNKVDDGVSVILNNSETASSNQQIQNYHFTRGLSRQTVEVERNRAYETTVAIDSSGNVKQFCIADIIL